MNILNKPPIASVKSSMKNIFFEISLFSLLAKNFAEVIKAKKDGKINQKEKSVLMTKFWAVLKVS